LEFIPIARFSLLLGFFNINYLTSRSILPRPAPGPTGADAPSRPDLGTHDLVAVAALCTLDGVPVFLEDDLAALLYAIDFPYRCREGSHSVHCRNDGRILEFPGLWLVEDHVTRANATIARGDGVKAAEEARKAYGILADIMVLSYILEDERYLYLLPIFKLL